VNQRTHDGDPRLRQPKRDPEAAQHAGIAALINLTRNPAAIRPAASPVRPAPTAAPNWPAPPAMAPAAPPNWPAPSQIRPAPSAPPPPMAPAAPPIWLAPPAAPIWPESALATAVASVSRLRTLARHPWPLVLVIALQAVMSLRLMWSDTAFGDEALYLSAGRLELAHLFHGTQIPSFPSYFSGAPVIYPPIAALADSVGGLTGARMLSLCFMLGATALLWAATSRLYGRLAAFFAIALWSVLGPTLHLGSFATYDALALFLLALAVWCALRAGSLHDAAGWMVASGIALILANVTKYATIIFDPVVVSLAVLAALPEPGTKRAVARGGMLLSHVVILAGAILAVCGGSYLRGLRATTLVRAQGYNSAASVLAASLEWIGVILIVALAAIMLSVRHDRQWHRRATVVILAATALLVPLEQARLHTLVSLNKHVDFGAWFAAIVAGYAMARIGSLPRDKLVQQCATVALAVAIIPMLAIGMNQSAKMAIWPGSANLIAFLNSRTAHGGHFLAETSAVPQYYLTGTSWRQWSNTFSITRESGFVENANGSPGPYIKALRHHYFSLVVLSYRETPRIDRAIAEYLRSSKSYRVIGSVPFSGPVPGHYTVWEYDRSRAKRSPACGACR